ncbi:MAG TPA: hypothetical protein PKV50_00080 [Prolixibacteraceae bacterium]|nr:hypothetical protein [Bacteroidales bacterium]HPB04616.1 hypothetical protein [Prolixibacteraceae bacterium]HQN92492.1 hypothetical protein [Prolixibacteraceae bacterium]HUM87894.1 hypothetical protein [Prolixibacteraceae bacterium]
MKKIYLVLLIVASMAIGAQAQISPHAIGLRLGGGSLGSAELSYQHGLGSANRLEFDLGWGGNSSWNRMNIVGVYHWLWNIDGGLNWYVGPGAALGLYSYKGDPGYVNVAIGGQIGLEYNFSKKGAPILLSIDARPMWDFLGDNAGLGWGAALGIRYTF